MKRLLLHIIFSICIIQIATAQTATTATISWQKLSGSDGVYGVTHNGAKPLQYKPITNTTTFTHLKSNTYTSSPANTKGDVVVMVSTNNGTSWDSTCVWSNTTNRAMFPQGAVYNPPGNSNPINTWIVTNGITTNTNNSTTGNFYASKQLSTFNSTASAFPNAQQFNSNSNSFSPAFPKHNYDCNSITTTDDGVIRSTGVIANDINSNNATNFGLRGAFITKGVFNAGSFNWTGDSLIPQTIIKTDGTKQLYAFPKLAFNSAGTVGYAVLIGSQPSGQLVNTGWQPIVYKTTNSGMSWYLANSINFNINPIFFASIINKLKSVNGNITLAIPQFNINEGFDITVDANNNLHIATTITSTKSSHIDSLDQTHQFGAQGYKWAHTAGNRPYLYDFLTNGSGWSYIVIDSLSSEIPGRKPTENGFASNGWDIDNNGNKVSSGARIQLSRSNDGRFIVYTYSESDTNSTNNFEKWNSIPNVKIKVYDAVTNGLATNKLNASNIAIGQGTNNSNVANKAYFHNASPLLESASGNIGASFNGGCIPANGTVSISLPLTVTNTNPLLQNANCTHWYSSVKFKLINPSIATSFPSFPVQSGLTKFKTNDEFKLYPNPFTNQLTLNTNLNELKKLIITNLLGQTVYQTEFYQNSITIDLPQLPNGAYFAEIINNGLCYRYKLIKE